ncbi:transcriptional regulator [Corynebacterium breve]|uniref:Transcriptional regulator n=1 Tax=Corynebacterium breve TaxID=3049799 RepID=A0ABY8VDN9_9CORY|nr:transcriptional regulator [Corynebacterium breve]WIM67222.1 transcriptional regulator [Corynebacterium breve]
MIDSVIHPINRLKICAALNAAGAVEADVKYEMRFADIRDAVDISDASLSKQLGVLEEAGYVTRFREYGLSRDKDTVWVTLTRRGKEAFDAHLVALREIAEG